MRRGSLVSGVVVLGSVVLSAHAVAAPSPIKTEKKLASELSKLESRLFKSHLKLGKVQKKQGKRWAAYLELLSARRLDPTHRTLAKLLPKQRPAVEDLDPEYLEARGELEFDAAQRLSALIERAVDGGLSETSLNAVALRLLNYEPDHLVGRAALGFQGEKQAWLSAHERRLRALYKAGFAKVKPPIDHKECPLPKLEEALGFKLKVFESEHAFAACALETPMPERLTDICKAADLAYEAIHYDLFGQSELLAEAKDRAPTGEPLKPMPKVIFLQFTTKEEHVAFLENVVTDPKVKAVGKTLGMVVAPWPAQKTIVCDSWGRGFEREWPAERMARFVVRVRFGGRRPAYLLQGLARYYSGHVSGRAFMRTVSVGSKSKGRKVYTSGSYDLLRADARDDYNAFRVPLPVDGGLFRSNESMTRGDNAMASAFVDYLIANDKPKLRALLEKGDAKERQIPALIQEVFGDDTHQANELFSLWFERNY